MREALIEERGFDALTVGEITARAMVSRATFYHNYQDTYHLVKQIFEEAMSTLLNAIGQMGPGQHHPEVWVRFFEHIAQYEWLYRALLGSKGSPWFVRKMRASLADLVKAHGYSEHVSGGQPAVGQSILTFSDDLVPDLVSTMLVEAITWWLEQGRASHNPERSPRAVPC